MERYKLWACSFFVCLFTSLTGLQNEDPPSLVEGSTIVHDVKQSLRAQLKKIKAQLGTIDKWRKPLESLKLASRARELKERLKNIAVHLKASKKGL